MRDAVIAEAVRTPAYLSGMILNTLVECADVDSGGVDDVARGCVGQLGEQAFDIARNAVPGAGWPATVPGSTVDRQCGSSQQAGAPRRGRADQRTDVGVVGGLNPNGGTIATGQPLGSSGARIITTLVHHMRDNNIHYDLQTLGKGGSQANATIFKQI